MTSMATQRRLGPCLVGLFLIAQICGVAPLIKCHSAHAASWPLVLSACQDGIGPVSHDHHHAGDADDAANHHALQDLNGVFGWLPDRSETALVHIANTPPPPRALVGADPVLLERPPKPFLSI
jgi:hypothetical protein